MNDKDTHDFEKLENLYSELIQEGLFSRGVQDIKSRGKAAGKYLGNIKDAFLGKSSKPLSPRAIRYLYKVSGILENSFSDVKKITGVSYFDEAGILIQILREAATSGKHPEIAKELVDYMNVILKRGTRPRDISDFVKYVLK